MAGTVIHFTVRVIGATVAILIASTSLMTAGGTFSAAAATRSAQSAPQGISQAVSQADARHLAELDLEHARFALAQFESGLVAARAELDASAGRTLDEAARQTLAARIDQQQITTDLIDAIAALEAALAPLNLRSAELWSSDGRVSPRTDHARSVREIVDSLPVVQAEISTAVAAVSEATRVWQVEQDRLAAEKAAAEKAAAQSAKRGQRPANVDGPITYHVSVRGSASSSSGADDAAVQAAIDGGGQIAVRYVREGITIIAAHNTSDATALSLRAGDIIVLSGALGGTWVVTGSMDASAGSSVSSVLGLGTGLLMQTCYFGSGALRVVGLAPA